jgi:hypothetical protein
MFQPTCGHIQVVYTYLFDNPIFTSIHTNIYIYIYIYIYEPQ